MCVGDFLDQCQSQGHALASGISPNCRMAVSGDRNSWETVAAKSDCNRATFNSRRTTRTVANEAHTNTPPTRIKRASSRRRRFSFARPLTDGSRRSAQTGSGSA
jgi:hypothetical protein